MRNIARSIFGLFKNKQLRDSFDPDRLRSIGHVYEPDPRQRSFSVIDRGVKGFRPITLADYQASVSKISLNANVPNDIGIQFETTKNLYLYSWFVYRFYPVAELHAFTCLELALRMRYEKEIPKRYYPRSDKPMFGSFLRYAIDLGDVKNEGFQRWHEAVEQRAHARYERERDEEMREKGLNEIELNYAEVQITDVDRNLDYVKILIETLPQTRNLYAHGTPMLHNTVLGTIELVSEISSVPTLQM